MKDNCGVYRITCLPTGRVYVGSSINIDRRLRGHWSLLDKGKHSNPRLQRAWIRYGASAFAAEVLVNCMPAAALELEQLLLDEHLSQGSCFNIALETRAPMAGRKHSADAHRRMSEAQKGRVVSAAVREHMRALTIGRPWSPTMREGQMKVRAQRSEATAAKVAAEKAVKAAAPKSKRVLSEEHRKALSEKLTGLKRSEQTREKMRIAARDRTEDRFLKVSVALTGRAKSDEHKAKISETKRLRFQDPEYAERQLRAMQDGITPESRTRGTEKMRERMKDPAMREQISKSLKGRKASNETKAKLSAAHKGKTLPEEQKALLSQRATERWARWRAERDAKK